MYNFNEYPFTLTVTDAERIASLHDNTRFSTHNPQER